VSGFAENECQKTTKVAYNEDVYIPREQYQPSGYKRWSAHKESNGKQGEERKTHEQTHYALRKHNPNADIRQV